VDHCPHDCHRFDAVYAPDSIKPMDPSSIHLNRSYIQHARLCTRRYVLNSSADAFKWTMWVITGCFALPAALLSTTMHVLRVWRGPRPLEDDNQHRAPLVDAAADVGQIDAAPAPPPPGRPVWPPPAGHAGLGADLLATGRVASAAQSGDYSQLSARDLAAASRTANAAAVVWPPPK